MNNKICDYGCGQNAKFYFKIVNKWCCCKHFSSCPAEKIKQKARPIQTNELCSYGCNKQALFKIRNKFCCSESFNSCKSKKIRSGLGNIGKTRNLDFCNKMSILKKGFKHTEETKKKLLGPRRKIENIRIKYKFFSEVEEMRYNPNNNKEIQVHCKNLKCKNSKENNGWFTPTGRQLELRICELEKGNKKGFLYCSNACKQEDPYFHKKVNIEINKSFISYKRLVDIQTNISIRKFYLENINLRGRKNGYSLDHIYSVWDGFINNIDTKIVGHIKNLRIILISKNSIKHKRSDINIDNLKEQIKKFEIPNNGEI